MNGAPLTVSASPSHLSPTLWGRGALLRRLELTLRPALLSPGQGERWHAQRDGERVLVGSFEEKSNCP
jgi:hypothetical protein